jgi:hypothetical protein
MNYLLMFPREPNLVSREAAQQFLGLRPRPRLNYLRLRQRLPVEWLALKAWCRLAPFLHGRATLEQRKVCRE